MQILWSMYFAVLCSAKVNRICSFSENLLRGSSHDYVTFRYCKPQLTSLRVGHVSRTRVSSVAAPLVTRGEEHLLLPERRVSCLDAEAAWSGEVKQRGIQMAARGDREAQPICGEGCIWGSQGVFAWHGCISPLLCTITGTTHHGYTSSRVPLITVIPQQVYTRHSHTLSGVYLVMAMHYHGYHSSRLYLITGITHHGYTSTPVYPSQPYLITGKRRHSHTSSRVNVVTVIPHHRYISSRLLLITGVFRHDYT
jgi:hypothetical protein